MCVHNNIVNLDCETCKIGSASDLKTLSNYLCGKVYIPDIKVGLLVPEKSFRSFAGNIASSGVNIFGCTSNYATLFLQRPEIIEQLARSVGTSIQVDTLEILFPGTTFVGADGKLFRSLIYEFSTNKLNDSLFIFKNDQPLKLNQVLALRKFRN